MGVRVTINKVQAIALRPTLSTENMHSRCLSSTLASHSERCISESFSGRPLTSRGRLYCKPSRCRAANSRHSIVTQATVNTQAVTTKADPFAVKEVYNDNFIDKLFIRLFSQKMSDQLGGIPFRDGFDGFVDMSAEIMKGRNTTQVQQTVAKVLASLMPEEAPATFRRLFPLSKASAEFNAWVTTWGFRWLVGPMTTQKVEIVKDGKTQVWRSGVKIKKCRYLEASGCVGMCTNMCKIPTQDFFTEGFGLPLTMNPNFDDLSCEMIFGRAPPALQADPVCGQPCFSQCGMARKGAAKPCPKLGTATER